MTEKLIQCPISADIYKNERRKGATREASFAKAMQECHKLYVKEHNSN